MQLGSGSRCTDGLDRRPIWVPTDKSGVSAAMNTVDKGDVRSDPRMWSSGAVSRLLVDKSWCSGAVSRLLVDNTWCSGAVSRLLVDKSWCAGPYHGYWLISRDVLEPYHGYRLSSREVTEPYHGYELIVVENGLTLTCFELRRWCINSLRWVYINR